MLLRLILLLTFIYTLASACGSSGSCGGCRAKARARAAKTGKLEDFKEEDDGNIFGLSVWNNTEIYKDTENKLRYTNPNFLFHRCCEERRLPDSCVQECHFNTFNQQVLQSMFVGTHKCPMEFLPEMQFCAAQGMDHRRCCSSKGVGQTTAGSKCLVFCDQRPDRYTPIDYSYAPCYDRFESMKRCFYDDVKVAAERRFLPLLLKKPENEGTGKNSEGRV